MGLLGWRRSNGEMDKFNYGIPEAIRSNFGCAKLLSDMSKSEWTRFKVGMEDPIHVTPYADMKTFKHKKD
jgi:hypothetical protein